MDDERLTARLVALDRPAGDSPPRPEFVDALHDDLARRLGFASGDGSTATAPVADAATIGRRSSRTTRRGRSAERWLLVAAAVGILVMVIGNVAGLGTTLRNVIDPPTLLDDLRSTTRMRVAIRPDAPQAGSPGAVIDGFDVDVAEDLGSRLGLRIDRVIEPADTMLDTSRSTWQVAMPSRALTPVEAETLLASIPYYEWPAYLVARRSTPTGLPGADLCVVAGSAGERWAAARSDVASIRRVADDADCLADVRAGAVDAMVTSQLLPTDLASDPEVVVVGEGPVVRELRSIIVPADAPGARELVALIDRALVDMRTDGTLSELSRQRFGGSDLTE